MHMWMSVSFQNYVVCFVIYTDGSNVIVKFCFVLFHRY